MGVAQNFKMQPYLEDAEPDHIHISWMTDSGAETTVNWGTTESLGATVSGTSYTNLFGDEMHEVELTGLAANTTYFYQVTTGALNSEVIQFKTPPLASAEQSFNFVAMSDMQRDGGNPTIFDQIVKDGVIPVSNETYGGHISDDLGFVIIPGDLVDNGLNYGSWMTEFFSPGEDLFQSVPVYPVLGNHEVNTPYYFDFFHLPENGSVGFEEQWYYKDYSNVRIIGLDSNSPFDTQAQLNWLQVVLNQSCSDTDIDFVFVQLHHPHHSELWLPGESGFSTSVVQQLETFSTSCGKPSIHFFGHTHGYSRGQSQEHDHVMVNVATAGGNIDYWGEFAQNDYPEFTVSQPEWGFVILEVEAGASPKFKLKRYSIGNEFAPLQNELKDELEVKLNNVNPDMPSAVSPLNETVSPDCLLLIGDDFSDSDGDFHFASQWQISTSATFNSTVYDEFKNHENWYFNVDTQAGDVMIDEKITGMPENASLFWRVRYRDSSLGWSSWSAAAAFSTGSSNESANLLFNQGAENAVNNWTVSQGVVESLTAGECDGTAPYTGSRYFCVGGACVESAFGEAWQIVDVTSYATDIDQGTQFAKFGAFMSDYNGADIPAVQIECLDLGNAILATSVNLEGNQPGWILHEDLISIPVGTRKIRCYMRGTRNGGADNDSYIDEVFVKISDGGCDDSVFDEDNDGIVDSIDNCLGLVNPDQADFNDNGVGDACEDSDGDGILDIDEINVYGTDPAEGDTDADGINDFDEIFTENTDPLLQDSDDDGLTDGLEVNQSGTDPNNPDTDGDGCTDDLEFSMMCPDNQCDDCPADLNDDLVINVSDLLIFLGLFGQSCIE
ncbi:MAG: hypothetical protein ACI84C_001077 [Flavobacteriales bacterium]|jgi:hypothetical protein